MAREWKRSVSSVLDERIRQRRAVTPVKHKVRFVKFSAEEMAYDVPKDTSGLMPVGRGWDSWRRFKKWKRNYARIESDLRRFFGSDRLVNEALCQTMRMMRLGVRRNAERLVVHEAKEPVSAEERRRWSEILTFSRGYVRLDPEIRRFFKDDKAVNEALREAMEMMKLKPPLPRRKTA
jgi:hypothetical protein